MGTIYLDTSALAKWYLNEECSEQVEAFIREHAPLAISTLTKTEMRCLLARRRREGNLDTLLENRIYAAFLNDIQRGHLVKYQVVDTSLDMAANLIASLPQVPLRTLDALHLSIALDLGADTVATADRIMALASRALELQAVTFFPAK